MTPAEFEPAILASERPHTHALDRATTGTKTEESSVQSLINDFISSITVILVDIWLRKNRSWRITEPLHILNACSCGKFV